MDNEQNNSVQLQTKVTPEIYAMLQTIGNKFGFTIYHCLRMLVEILVRLGDDQHNLHEDLMRAIRQFENIPGWANSICLADPDQEIGIVEAIYIMRARGKEGYRMCLVERPMLDNDSAGWSVTYNVQRILERFIEVMNPSLYKHLRLLAVELGTTSMLDTIQRIADEFMENPDEIELRLQFEQNDYERGNRVYQDTHYKRPYTPSEEHLQKTLFDDNQ